MKDRHGQEEARQQWDWQSPAAFELKETLEHAFRERADLLKKVQAIEEGSGNADLVQDLSDLSVLGGANLPLLTKVRSFDAATLQTADALSAEMSELLALMNDERAGPVSASSCVTKPTPC